MNKFIAAAALLVASLLLSCGQQPKEPTVDDLVSKMVATLGGPEKLAAIQDQVSTWDSQNNVPMGDSLVTMTSELVITYKRPNKIKFESFGPDGSVMYESVYDGTAGWMSMMGQSREMVESELQENATLATTWIDGWHNYKANGLTLALLPDTTLDGKTYHVVQSTDKHGNVSTNYCDPQTHMVARMESVGTDPMTMQPSPFVMTFSNYADHNGFMMPSVVASYGPDGTLMWQSTLKTVENNAGVTDDDFAMDTETAEEEME